MILNIISNFPSTRFIFLHFYCPFMAMSTDSDTFWGFVWICVFDVLCFCFITYNLFSIYPNLFSNQMIEAHIKVLFQSSQQGKAFQKRQLKDFFLVEAFYETPDTKNRTL